MFIYRGAIYNEINVNLCISFLINPIQTIKKSVKGGHRIFPGGGYSVLREFAPKKSALHPPPPFKKYPCFCEFARKTQTNFWTPSEKKSMGAGQSQIFFL